MKIEVVIIILVIIVLCRAFFFLFFKNKEWYNKISTLINDTIVLAAIAFAYISFQQANKSLEQTDKSLVLTKNALISSDSVSQLTINFLDSISRSSSGVKSNLDSVADKLELFPYQIDDISKNITSLNRITQQQVESIEKEQQRKPLLNIYINCVEGDNKVYLLNVGDIEAEVIYYEYRGGGSNGTGYSIDELLIPNIPVRFEMTRLQFFSKGGILCGAMKYFKVIYKSVNGKGGTLEGDTIYCLQYSQ